jgi:RimJ/RimL family protein N-acetyltransferase
MIDREPPLPTAELEIPAEGIILRKFTPADAPIYWNLLQRNERFLSQRHIGGWDDTGQKYHSEEEVLQSILHPDPPDEIQFGIWDDNTMVGNINARPGEEAGSVEIGYALDKNATGQGYATRAVRGLSDHAFRHLGANNISAHVYVGNRKSRHVLARVGFKYVRFYERHRSDRNGILRTHSCYSKRFGFYL